MSPPASSAQRGFPPRFPSSTNYGSSSRSISVRPKWSRLDQHWTDEQRQQFHHTPQGTRLLPADWFKALEQPCFSPFGCDLFADPAYLSRFGFIPSHADALNPDGLPIGFAIDKDFVDPIDKRGYPVVGLTCAACHTGRAVLREVRGAGGRRAGDDRGRRVPEGARPGAGVHRHVPDQRRPLRPLRGTCAGAERDRRTEGRAQEAARRVRLPRRGARSR